MDGALLPLVIFLVGTFTAAFVAALAGFALGVVALAIWLYAITPVQAAALIAAYALIVQGYAVWKLRRSVDFRRLLPFVVGGAVGIPAGIYVLKWASPASLRNAVGVLLVLFAIYNIVRPQLPQVRRAGSVLDGVVGVFNGALGASTGLGGTLPAIWCGTRGWGKDEQRAVFQPAAVATFLMMMLWLGGAGILNADIGWLFIIGLPALAAGTWLGWALYGRLDESAFRKVVLYVVLVSGFALVAIVDRGGTPTTRQDAGPVSIQQKTTRVPLPYEGERDVLRVRKDYERNRVWVLGLDRVDVYDLGTKELLRRIALPDLSVVSDAICEPDLALDRSGAAWVSDNMQPRLWRIDFETFQPEGHVVRLVGRERWDIGFGALAFAPDGSLLGVTASGGSLWTIDTRGALARQVALDALVPDACPFLAPVAPAEARTDRTFALCAGLGGESRRIELAPDLSRGQVLDEPCGAEKGEALLRRASAVKQSGKE